jgi:hexosaminidase
LNNISIIPQPTKVNPGEGVFELKPSTHIVSIGDARKPAKFLQEFLQKASGFPLELLDNADGQQSADTIQLQCSHEFEAQGDEGYILDISPERVLINAFRPAGIFYGIQTLRQLFPIQIEDDARVTGVVWSVPVVTVHDQPRFAWRGMMLDVCRHMFPVEFIKRLIDLLAMHKMNVFHWHLTDDQGWRIEIKKYPQLTEKGAWRNSFALVKETDQADGIRYGGYYTQEQIRDVIAYAGSRYIRVVPEIEMPGHSAAALTAFPELGCTGGPYTVRTSWGIEKDIFCAGKEETFSFLEDVLSEVIELFPSEFLHVGGDECPKERWKNCPKCQARIEGNGLKDEDELQSYFIQRIEKFLNEKGRRMIGWDEILEGGLAPNATVMSWRGMEGGVAAAKARHDVIMSPTTHCYLDYPPSDEPDPTLPGWMEVTSVEKAYQFEPVPESLSATEATHILGGQTNLWTEFVPDQARAERMIFPRASALAEVMWSPVDQRDSKDFSARLEILLRRLDELKVNYWRTGI